MQKGIQLVLATTIISGVSIFLNAFGVKGLNPFAFTGAKNLLVAVFILSIIFLATRASELKKLSIKQWGKLSLIGLIGGSIPFLLFFKGLSMGTGATGSFIHKTMIVWVVLGAIIFFKEKLNWKLVTGAGLLLAGNFFLLQLAGIEFSAGLIYIIIATLFWSAEIILAKHTLKDISGTTVAFGRMGFGSVFILVFLIITGNLTAILTWTSNAWLWVLITSVFLVGYVLTFYNGLKLVKASTAVAILSIGAVITTLLQIIFLEKIVTTSQVLGLVLLIGGVAFVWWSQKISFQSTSSTA